LRPRERSSASLDMQAPIRVLAVQFAVRRDQDIQLTGLLYMMFSALVENNPSLSPSKKTESLAERYVEQVMDFIHMNYASKIAVADIADFIGLNRSYICSLFKQRTNSSIQDYLIRYRLHKACELMNKNELSIGDISRSVGYSDPLLFSKIFKKFKGVPPTKYRAQLSE
jgi:YesN/AraC family two-component response regulator